MLFAEILFVASAAFITAAVAAAIPAAFIGYLRFRRRRAEG